MIHAMKGIHMTKERMLAFTDAVLAIIMTILVLELEKPSELSFSGLWELRRNFFAYALSFFYIGSMWISMNRIWEHVKRLSGVVIWWNLIFLFFSSFMPYATGIVSNNFDDRFSQVFYGSVIIAITICHLILHKLIDSPNSENETLLETTKEYRRMLLPDIIIKVVSLILAVCIYPPVMMYGALFAAAYFQFIKAFLYRKKKRKVNSK